MAQDYAKQFYRSQEWQKCRVGYIANVNGLCQRCLRVGRITPGKIVHHKTKLTAENIKDQSISLGWDNLELLCQDCHNYTHHGSGKGSTQDGLCFNERGELIRL